LKYELNMKLLTIFLFLCFFYISATYAHSGGTDKNGCHAGSQPYHCHNEGSSSENAGLNFNEWDLNLGYQYLIDESQISPYIGFSVGKSDHHESILGGIDIGFKHRDGFYAGYITTSESVQLGYKFFHVSVNSNGIGFGLRCSFGNAEEKTSLPFYYSGTFLVSRENE
jgi:hypothetical protein